MGKEYMGIIHCLVKPVLESKEVEDLSQLRPVWLENRNSYNHAISSYIQVI